MVNEEQSIYRHCCDDSLNPRGPAPPLWRIPLFADGLEEALPARFRYLAGDAIAADVTAVEGPSS